MTLNSGRQSPPERDRDLPNLLSIFTFSRLCCYCESSLALADTRSRISFSISGPCVLGLDTGFVGHIIDMH